MKPISLSIIVLSHNIPSALNDSPNFSGFPIYAISEGEPEKPASDSIYLQKADGEIRVLHELNTSWALFLEEDEFLLAQERRKLLNYCKKNHGKPVECTVERFLPQQELKKFAWVTTRDAFDNPPQAMRRDFTSEIRLISSADFKGIRISSASGIHALTPFILEVPTEPHDTAMSRIVISRTEKALPVPEKKNKPKDRDIFRRGHQKYFDDTIFSPRFEWPHTVYHTIRLEHVPAIMEALKTGLSTPDIVLFALVYLVRFRNFSKASEVVALLPEHWFARNHPLMNVVATLHFINGNHKKALSLFQQALTLYPDSEWLAQNAIKINLLLDHHDAIASILCNYRDATGQELEDDYLNHFKAVHRGLPKRPVTLSLCLIIKDEEKNIARAISSAKQMADEIIVVDTGSTDNSTTIAERLGAKVYHYAWHNDFSAVRNFAMEKATGDYIFMLDGDEYISPFYFLECQTLKKLLPLDKPSAFKLAIGSYFNDTDWLFVVSETGNFRVETSSIRLFPRREGIQYTGCIAETIEPSLMEQGIPVQVITDDTLHILHEPEQRRERIARKCHIFKKISQPNYSQILLAIKEFSIIGRSDETLAWLKHLYDNQDNDDTGKLKMGLHLAKLLETREPDRAEQFYQHLMDLYPRHKPVQIAYIEYLILHNQLGKIRQVSFHEEAGPEGQSKANPEFECFKSLQFFEAGDLDAAFQTLLDILNENTFHPFAQALRFYYLIRMNELDGAVSSLDILFKIMHSHINLKIDSLDQLVSAAEELCKVLLKNGYLKERSMILHGALTLAKQWG